MCDKMSSKTKAKMDVSDPKELLAQFSLWIAQRYGLPADESAVAAEIELFLSEQDGTSDESKAKMKSKSKPSRGSGEDFDGEYTGYHG